MARAVPAGRSAAAGTHQDTEKDKGRGNVQEVVLHLQLGGRGGAWREGLSRSAGAYSPGASGSRALCLILPRASRNKGPITSSSKGLSWRTFSLRVCCGRRGQWRWWAMACEWSALGLEAMGGSGRQMPTRTE